MCEFSIYYRHHRQNNTITDKTQSFDYSVCTTLDTSASGLLVLDGTICPVVSVSTLTWISRYIVYSLLKLTVTK
jgi:hypothetical protein